MSKKNKNKKQPNPGKRAIVWGIVDKIVAIFPILLLAIFKWDDYFSTKTTFSNIVGFTMMGALVGIILSKKTEMLKGVWGFYFFFIIVYTLRAIMTDIVLISGIACIGVTISALWTSPKKKKWESRRDKTESAEINANAFMNMFTKQKEREGEISGRA